MTREDFRRLARSLPEAKQSAHMGHPDFRVRGKVFATLGYPSGEWGMVKLDPLQQQLFLATQPAAFLPVKGEWGRRGATSIRLKDARTAVVAKALRAAFCNVAPESLVENLPKAKSSRTLIELISRLLSERGSRREKARKIAEAIRAARGYRWVGLYDVNKRRVSNIAWSGPAPPAFPSFPVTKGLTSKAIATRRLVNVGDVRRDSSYLATLESTGSEIIVPILDRKTIVGTIDVEGERINEFGARDERILRECARALKPLWRRMRR